MAGFGMQLNAKIAQHQKLSPQMQFRQKILAMGNLELTQQIHQALETNPARAPVRNPASAPRLTPVIITIAAVGLN